MPNTNDLKFMLSGSTLSLYAKGNQRVIQGSDATEAIELIKQGELDKVYDLYFTVPVAIANRFGDKNVELKDGTVFVDGRAVSGLLNSRLVEYLAKGLPVGPLVGFWRRLQANPSNRAVTRLFECLDKNHHPLVEDGRFLAWKRVRSDFKDIYSGKFDNSVGAKPSILRNEVDENMDQTCSYGLHVSSFEYASNTYGNGQGVLLEVLVDPADVVAIPRDYNDQKMRVCKYEVIREVTEKRLDALVTKTGETINPEDYDNYDDEWDDNLLLEDDDDEEDDENEYLYGDYDDEDEDEDSDWDGFDDDDDVPDLCNCNWCVNYRKTQV